MEFSDKAKELYAEYEALHHAVQTGVGYEIAKAPQEAGVSSKGMRTGINMAMVHYAAIVELLVEKGLFTYEEYFASLVKKTREEKERYEARLTKLYGAAITLI